ncbi:MAG: hypothetical protein ACREIC_03930, partial [Limisphaerales bacterium]
SMTANGGSSTHRNLPDVAMAADNVYVLYGNGSSSSLGGTSCAAPLWAALAALANQQALAAGKAAIGFFNPAIYAVGKGSSAGASFHDTTTGNNFWSSSPNSYSAAPGYDLCTGWGTPAGQALIDALSGSANALSINPAFGFYSGPVGGPFSADSETFVMTNSSSAPLAWSLVNTSAWLEASVAGGTLAAASATPVTVSLTPAAYGLAPGSYDASLLFTNQGGGAFSLNSTLSVGQSVLQNGDFEAGDFSGWTLVGNTISGGNVYNAVEDASSGFDTVHSGTYGAFLGDTKLASLSQNFTTVPGGYYLVSLWLDNPAIGSGQQFVMNWQTNGTAGETLFRLSSPPAFAWTNLQFIVRASGTNSTLQIQAENDSNYFGADDVSVTPLPLPAFRSVSALQTGIQLSWVAAPGLTYQVEYKTDLLQPNWTPIGSAFVATNSTASFTDPEGSASAPQRFYRLRVAP